MFFNEYSRLSYYLMTLEGVIFKFKDYEPSVYIKSFLVFKDSNLLAADLSIFI